MRTFPAISCALALASLLLGVAPSCTPGSAPEACAPGRRVTCPCDGGETGIQVCRDDGSGYGPCTSCGASPVNDASLDADTADAPADGAGGAPADAGTDAPDDADMDAPDDGDASDASTDAPVDAAQSPFCTVTNPNCGFPPGATGGCCLGTVCDQSQGTLRCCVEDAHPCNISSDCCDATEICNSAGVCSPPPGCRDNGQACGPGHPEVTGCCSPGAVCETAVEPALCCQPAGTACQSDADCCLQLSCGAGGVCQAPSCVPTGYSVDCAVFPGTPCCDQRLQCSTPTPSMPDTRCCAPSGTVLVSTDSPSLCCGTDVLTLPDGSLECVGP
jgi:hypothetical protein